MGVLQDIGMKHGTDKATYHKYCDFYEENLPGRDFTGRLLEIGVMDGNSLRMWREYYPKAKIVGIDIALQSDLRIDGVDLMEMDGTDSTATWQLGLFDIIVDDGSHMTSDQQASFNYLYYNHLNSGGHYILEDLHTSFWPRYVDSPVTTIDFLNAKRFADGKDVTLWRRDENEDDSITSIIRG